MKRHLMIILIFVILFCGGYLLYYNLSVNVILSSTSIQERKPINIVIDCGHGGEDGGAVSPSGMLEKDVNLQIGLSLEKLMRQSGFSVTMIRSTDKSVADSDKTTLRDKKVSDLHNRVRIVNSDSNNILISIHQNIFEDSRYSGTQVFYSDNNSGSKDLAENIRLAVKGLLQKDNERQCKVTSDNIFLLKKSDVPAVLVECGFLSNPQEESKLSEKEYRDQLAFCIYTGFLEYYYQNY